MGAPGLLHFLYKSKIHVQFTCPDFTGPYTEDVNQKRLYRLYQYVYDRMHCRARPLKLYYHDSEQEIILGWVSIFFVRIKTKGKDRIFNTNVITK